MDFPRVVGLISIACAVVTGAYLLIEPNSVNEATRIQVPNFRVGFGSLLLLIGGCMSVAFLLRK